MKTVLLVPCTLFWFTSLLIPNGLTAQTPDTHIQAEENRAKAACQAGNHAENAAIYNRLALIRDNPAHYKEPEYIALLRAGERGEAALAPLRIAVTHKPQHLQALGLYLASPTTTVIANDADMDQLYGLRGIVDDGMLNFMLAKAHIKRGELEQAIKLADEEHAG